MRPGLDDSNVIVPYIASFLQVGSGISKFFTH